MQVSMALLPSTARKIDFAKVDKKHSPAVYGQKEAAFSGSDDDDLVPMRKKKKFDPKEISKHVSQVYSDRLYF